MRIVLQRVSKAKVSIHKEIKGSIEKGLVLLLGIGAEDTNEDIQWLVQKIAKLRIFSDEEGKMNLDIKDVKGRVLVVSQFTLHAKIKKGTRPSFIRAAVPEIAIPLYETFVAEMEKELGLKVETGTFGADMDVQLVNDGPVTLILDSKNRE